MSIIGTGYVGSVMGAAFSEIGYKVVLVDVAREPVDAINKGRSPIYEPGLEEIIAKRVRKGDLRATTDMAEAVYDTSITFICVGTPSQEDGSIDLTYVKEAARGIGKALRYKNAYHVIVVKSTVVPGTTEDVVIPILEKASDLKAGKDFGVCFNPEFFREGCAVLDSLQPDRIIVGALDKRSGDVVMPLFRSFQTTKIRTDLATAEMIKYVSNIFLATKIALSNEVANICSAYGMDVYEVMEGVGSDRRIGTQFLNAGAGFGGSCFPKDIDALRSVAKKARVRTMMLDTVMEVNEAQPNEVVKLCEKALGGAVGKNVAVLGLSFKAGTDDVRMTRALPIVQSLVRKGAKVTVYDPLSMHNFKALAGKNLAPLITFAKDMKDAIKGKDAMIVQAEWPEFKALDPSTIKKLMRTPIVVDGRRTFDPRTMEEAGIWYVGIGWKNLLLDDGVKKKRKRKG